jgi:hypothetical protein
MPFRWLRMKNSLRSDSNISSNSTGSVECEFLRILFSPPPPPPPPRGVAAGVAGVNASSLKDFAMKV